jgi:hypothetical protein
MYTYTMYTPPGVAPVLGPSIPPSIPMMPPPVVAPMPAVVQAAHASSVVRAATWMFKITSATVAIAVGTSERMHHLAEYLIDATFSKGKSIGEVMLRDEEKYVTKLVLPGDSAKVRKLPPVPVPLIPKRELGRKHSLKHASKLVVHQPKQTIAVRAEQPLTQAEEQQRVGHYEGTAWGQFVRYSGLRDHTRLFGLSRVVVMKGVITNTASVATYKELVLHVSFFSQAGELQGEENKIIHQLIAPGTSLPIKYTFTSPIRNPVVDFKITSVDYLLPHL